MKDARPFQKATTEVVLKAFRRPGGSKRFLVADEVGLGKTVVAQHVINGLMEDRASTREPLVVFYICSNLTIARQNRDQLLEVLPERERAAALCPVDRLTLLPAHNRLAHPRLHLYSLTPETSLPMRAGHGRRDGRQDERALIEALVRKLWPDAFRELRRQHGRQLFQRSARKWWAFYLQQARNLAKDTRLSRAFYSAVREEFGVEPNARIVNALLTEESKLALIARFRNALAASAVASLRPHLVIFDEFQRFRDLVAPALEENASRVLHLLRGEGEENPPALLLLSATPYRFYSQRHEDALGQPHHEEFFELLEFLHGSGTRARSALHGCRTAFAEIERSLCSGQPNSIAAETARTQVRRLLRPVMARTERASHPHGAPELGSTAYPARLFAEDVAVFRHLSASFLPEHRNSAVPYWSSIPLPMQSMGNRYLAWAQASFSDEEAPMLTRDVCEKLQKLRWPHPRMRALKELAPSALLSLPWIAPSLPWWPLDGLWKPSRNPSMRSKILVFSRFRAAPQAISALLSYDLEADLFNPQPGARYSTALEPQLLPAGAERFPILGHFHPAPWLIEHTEPLAARNRTCASALRAVEQQIREVLRNRGIGLDGRSARPPWRLLAGLEKIFGTWRWVHSSWRELHRINSRSHNSDAGLAGLLDGWNDQPPIDSISLVELRRLARHALTAPGIVLGRALYRHWPEAITQMGFQATLAASWNGLRNYLDNPLFAAALSRDENYLNTLSMAVEQGNLESALDEHLWITHRLSGRGGAHLAEALRDSLQLRVGRFDLHGTTKKPDIRLRCHAAMPFIEARAGALRGDNAGGDERPLRTDELKKAFNTPFWPHVLSTTSVGQEGLDFHAWCDSLVHWDLCANPVDLEQREGRIQRFGGLTIRRRIAAQLALMLWGSRMQRESPWARLATLAEGKLSDPSGLSPWWILPGAEINRYVFDLPGSVNAQRWSELKRQRLLYRLVLGQPNQEDLIEQLRISALPADSEAASPSMQLSPYFDP